MARTIVTQNRRIASLIDRRWPYKGIRIFDDFPKVAEGRSELGTGDCLVDIGAGGDSSFLLAVKRRRPHLRVIGIDVDGASLEANSVLDERHIVDVGHEALPLDSASVGGITSRSVLEHIADVDSFVAESGRVMETGGVAIHLCSCRNAPFAVIARLLSDRLAQRLLFALYPEVVNTQGFKTYYDRCTPDELARVFTAHNFEIVEQQVSYRSAQYFVSLGPLFLLARAYESILGRLNLKKLASYTTIVARRTAATPAYDVAAGKPPRSRPRVVYWFPMPAPYMVDRFNRLGGRDTVDFQAWFNARREPHYSGAWIVDESSWQFDYRYVPQFFVRGRSVGMPLGLLAKEAPSLIVSPHGEPSFVAGWQLARARGIRTAFWVVKTSESWTKRVGYKEKMKRYMFPRTDAILVPGDDAQEYAESYGAHPDRIFTVPHPVDGEYLRAVSELRPDDRDELRHRLGVQGTTFVYVGRLWWGKGINHLLSAFGEVQREVDDVSLLILGNGDERGGLEQQVKKESLRNVVFGGFVQKLDLPRYLSASDVFVFPTLGDPFGLVIGEAMACGLPVIATTATGELKARIEDGRTGFIVPPAASEPMAQRMLELASNPKRAKQMGELSKEKISPYTPARWVSDFENAVEELLNLSPSESHGH